MFWAEMPYWAGEKRLANFREWQRRHAGAGPATECTHTCLGCLYRGCALYRQFAVASYARDCRIRRPHTLGSS